MMHNSIILVSGLSHRISLREAEKAITIECLIQARRRNIS